MTQLNSMEDFQRDVTYRVLKRQDGSIGLTATMNDRFHDLEVRVVVAADSMAITKAEVEFRQAPTSDCPNVARRLEKLVGLVIGPGLNRALTEALGGSQGCGNLRTLFQGLLPLAINVKAAAGYDNDREMLDAIHDRLIGTCAGYVRK